MSVDFDMTQKIDHARLKAHAARLNEEVKSWTPRMLRSTYSSDQTRRTMKTYFDLTPAERAKLDEDDIAFYVDLELMKEGLAVPEKPKLQDVPVVEIPTETRYVLRAPNDYGSSSSTTITFDSEEDALEAVRRMSKTYYYYKPYGSSGEFRKLNDDEAFQVCSVTVPMESVKKMHKSALDEASRIEDENKTAQNEYNDLRKKADELTAPIWTDFWERRRVARKVDDVIETFKNYIDLANGDMEIAKTFLRKAYPNYYSETLEEGFDLVGMAEVQFLAASQS